MDTPIATPQPLPRLRVLRAPPSGRQQNSNTSVTSSVAGPSRLTDFTQLVDLNLSDIRAAHEYTDEDEEQDQYPTPRMNTPAPLATSSATPTPSLAGRLRELIHLVPNGSGSQATPTLQRPPSPTFHESDFEGEVTSNNHSHARSLVQSIFTRARREPGDTPQKGKQRRNSDGSASENDPSPKSLRGWSDTEGKRKSFSDEESENSIKPGNGSSYSNHSSQRDILRSSRDTHTIEFPLKAISADDDDSDDAEDYPRRISPSNATSAPLQSLRISQNSSFPQHSNLLDQDSEMHRAFGEFDSVGERSARSHDELDEPSGREGSTVNISTVTPGPSGKTSATEKSRSHRPTRMSLDSRTPSSHLHHSPSTSRTTPRNQPQEERSVGINGRDSRERRTSLQGHTPPTLKHKSSASLQFSDQSSAMSISDYKERTKDMERERNREREREWNKRHSNNVRPNSGLSFHSPGPRNRSRTSSISSLESPRPGSALSNMSMESVESPQTRKRVVSGLGERQRTRTPSFSGSSRPGSALSNHSSPVPDFPQGLRRHHSLVSRADSPASVNSASGKEEVVAEIQQERERNWNARHPKWHRRSLPNTPDRPESPNTSKSASPHSPAHHRHERTTSTPDALRETPNILHSRSSLPRQGPLHSRIAPLSPSPAERKHGSLIPKSPNSSRLSTVTTSTPARPRSPLPKPTSQTKSRLPLSTKRSHESNMETPKAVPSIQIQDETEEAQAKSTSTFPRSVNGQSLSQESMELTEAYNMHEATSALPSFSDYSHLPTPNNDTMHTASLLGPNSIHISMQDINEGSEDVLEQERTPTLQTINPLTEENQQHELQDSSSLMHTTPESIEPAHEPESPDFPPADGNQSSLTPSFLLTPPRSRQSFLNSSKPEFHTPPPPRGLPELPEPPSLGSDDETDDNSIPQIHSDLSLADITPAGTIGGGNGVGDFTALKTPKPPGAWLATPAPSAKVPVFEDDDSAGGFVDSSDIDLPKSKPSHSQSIFPQTPAPPGGWAYTPLARQRAYSDPKSTYNEEGFAASVAPPGRAHTMPSKTPIGPGGWSNTPGVARKSILKVRFDPDVTGQGHESSDALPDSIVGLTHKPSSAVKPSSVEARSTTPEPVRPVTPPPSRSPRKHKRSPSVRVVDAFGNEQKDPVRKRDTPSPTPSTPRNRSGIRIVNALGEEVKEEPVITSDIIKENSVEQSQITPLTRVEALERVRQGIQELAEGIESLDLMSSSREDDSTRIEELDKASRELKQSREQLAQNMHKVENELKHQVRQVVFTRRWLGRNVWFLFFVGVAQVLLIFIMYRASVLQARKMFLTNYYDPFNPDLFLYTTNPDTQYTAPTLSWSLVTQAIRRQDFTAFMGAVWKNLSILIKKWHQQIWDVWGDDPSRAVGVWPPT